MRLLIVAAALGLLVAEPAAGAQTFDAGQAQAGPALTAGGVAWAAADARGSVLRTRAATGPTLDRVVLKGSTYADGFYGVNSYFGDLSAHGDELAYTVSTRDSAASKYDGGDGQTNSSAYRLAPGGTPQSLRSCGYLAGDAGVGIGDGFTILRNCLTTTAFDPAQPGSTVSIDATNVGLGSVVAAAGAYAAWQNGSSVLVAQPGVSTAPIGTVSAGGGWALDSSGALVTAASGVGTTMLAVTPPGGTSTVIGDEPGGVIGLAAGGGTIAYATQGQGGAQTIVVRQGAVRTELAHIWAAGGSVSTDGTRVAWFSARCGGTDLTVATIGEPTIDQRVAPCAPVVAPTGGLQRTRIGLNLSCDRGVAPGPCLVDVTVRLRGRVIATASRDVSQNGALTLRLNAAGRRAVRGRQRTTVRVTAARPAGGATGTTRATVRLKR